MYLQLHVHVYAIACSCTFKLHNLASCTQRLRCWAKRVCFDAFSVLFVSAGRGADRAFASELWSGNEPCGVAGGQALVIDEGQPSVDVFQLHQDHGPRTVVAATRYEAFAMGVHHHEHAASPVGDDFPVVSRSVQYGIGTFGRQHRLRLAPAGEEVGRCAQAKCVLVVVEVVLRAVEVVPSFVLVDVSPFVGRRNVVGLAAFGVVQSVLRQFADVVALAVHVAIDEVVSAVVVEEVLSVL